MDQHRSRRPHLIAAAVATSALVLAAPVARPAAAQVPVPTAPVVLPKKIEKLSPYLPQASCDPVAKPGVIAFARLVRRTYPGTGNSGITRGCAVPGCSEHKEGRAWDWAVLAHDRADAAEASALLNWLLRKDARGKEYGNAGRLGIMYIIWNRRIWIAAQAKDGWRAYIGANPHADHVHFSFGWVGGDAPHVLLDGQGGEDRLRSLPPQWRVGPEVHRPELQALPELERQPLARPHERRTDPSAVV